MIPIVDVFAGCGGLGEGFVAHDDPESTFDTVLSIEREPAACHSLQVRAFFHAFRGAVPDAYYDFMRGECDFDDLAQRHPEEAALAASRVLETTLGDEGADDDSIDTRIRRAINAVPGILDGRPVTARG